jgi:hypothetical protein
VAFVFPTYFILSLELLHTYLSTHFSLVTAA